MNLSPSPLVSRVHVLKLPRKVEGFALGFTCWLPSGLAAIQRRNRSHSPRQTRVDSLRNSSLQQQGRAARRRETAGNSPDESPCVPEKKDGSRRWQTRGHSRRESPDRSECGRDRRKTNRAA